MIITDFDRKEHGFAFLNHWTLKDKERKELHSKFIDGLKSGEMLEKVLRDQSLSVQTGPIRDFIRRRIFDPTFGGLRKILNPAAESLRKILAGNDNLKSYGLCGGMCLAALDFFYHSDLDFPKGKDEDDRPAVGTPLRKYIHKRQVDSLIDDVVKYLAWFIVSSYAPDGTSLLAKWSSTEWDKLERSLRAGDPVPLFLLRDTKDLFGNHQVLAIGCNTTNKASRIIYLYDPNCQDQSTISGIDFREQELDAVESCGKPHLRGFFCGKYTLFDPTKASD